MKSVTEMCSFVSIAAAASPSNRPRPPNYLFVPLTLGDRASLYAFQARDERTSRAKWPCPRMNLPDATRRCKRPRAFPLDSGPVCRISSNLLVRTLFARRACRCQELTPKCQAELEQVAQYGPRFRWLPCRLHITRTVVCRGRCHLAAIRPSLASGN